ncbi:MAG: T9SS type A sorting domain-containing protein, partial [Gemmatimonadota bacterium]
FTSTMVDDQYSWLMSPPIDISGAEKLVGQWDYWFDFPEPSGDYQDLLLASDDLYDCVTDPAGFVDEEPGGWFGGPFWGTYTDDWDAFAGNDWLAIVWEQAQDSEASVPHMAGTFLNWQKVGIPAGGGETVFEVDFWNDFHDWFQDQYAQALLDTGEILVDDDDGVTSVYLMASNDDGMTWEGYSCRRESEQSNVWLFPPPVNQMGPGEETHFYFTATDGLGNVAIEPDDAPDHYYEFSILPITATVSNPGILLVDKHARPLPGEDRAGGGLNYERPLTERHSQYYYAEILEILGYEWDVFDVDVESGSNNQSDGPDSSGYKYYDTQIWFTSEFDSYIIDAVDQIRLIAWLNQAGEGKERNLLMTGNDVGYELMEVGRETLSFYETWLGSTYLDDAVGAVTVDTVPTLRDNGGGTDFMTYDDGECLLAGGCPLLGYFDVVEPRSGVPGTELVADYVRDDSALRPAGVAYSHPTLGYQTVNLGFGMEFMMGSRSTGTPGYWDTGVFDRLDLLSNVMDYFGKTPGGSGTGIDEAVTGNRLSHAYPNPFNPVTKIAYSVKETGPVMIEVYNVAGKVVRTLLDTEAEAGTSGFVVWDGTDDGGERCASGVYFYRIAATGFSSSRKMVMLK